MLWTRLPNGNLAAPLFCIAAVAANHSVFRFGAMSSVWPGVLGLSVAFIAVLAPHVQLASGEHTPLKWFNIALGGLIVAPLLVVFALSFGRDFPFSGDQYGHVGQVFRLGFWWLSPLASPVVRTPSADDIRALLHHPAQLVISRAFVMLLIVTATVLIYRRWRLAALAFLTAALVLWGLHEQTVMLRYPGGNYLAALPFLGPAFLLGEADLAGRAANIVAPLVWLFVLRPWLVGRWPDWRIVAVGALVLWHRDVIYYFNSDYLEPWAVIFALLAVEVLIVRGPLGASLACLLVGAAAAVKEPFIVALPFVWLAGAPWRQSLRDALTSVGAGLAAGIPFVIYFMARKDVLAANAEDARNLHFGVPDVPVAEYVHEFLHRAAFAFPGTSAILLIGALALIPFMILRGRSQRWAVLLLGGAGLGVLMLFVVENDSLGWIGYFRFLLPALPFFAVGLFAFGSVHGRRAAIVVAVLALFLQAPGMVSAVAQAAGPVTRYNFTENYDAPIFFPIKELLREARREGWLAGNASVFGMAPDTSLRPVPGLPLVYAPPGQPVCVCSDEHPVVMALFVRYANLNAALAAGPPAGTRFGPPAERYQLWRDTRAERPACLARLRQTCAHVLTRVEDGELVAILGGR